jgi:hypothetical protein
MAFKVRRGGAYIYICISECDRDLQRTGPENRSNPLESQYVPVSQSKIVPLVQLNEDGSGDSWPAAWKPWITAIVPSSPDREPKLVSLRLDGIRCGESMI